jgi:excisionase family DNA binding protein
MTTTLQDTAITSQRGKSKQLRNYDTYTWNMENNQQPIYLTLSAASKLLGVHSTTLRRWADNGAIPVYITPGGHRRFARADVEAMVARSTLPSVSPRQGMMSLLTQRAWAQARTELERFAHTPDWLQKLGDEERDNWRRVSQQLMGVVLRYVGTQDDEDDKMLLDQARAIGMEYASHVRRRDIPLSKALEAALFFRDLLVSAVMDLPENATMRAENTAQLLRRISRVLNVVQIAVASEYEEVP